ncbi:hypothetical protein GF325_09695 [Candidatus Bathyarchaeota archaeon]|nr:hypothetical protein [Candidatus Bathyarchaeota archaeon]
MKKTRVNMVFLLISLFVLPALVEVIHTCNLAAIDSQYSNREHILPSQGTPDNVYYREDLALNILKGGDLIKSWSLVDNGLDQISFPCTLSSPLNATHGALLDLRVRIAAVKRDKLPKSWGPITYQDINHEFAYDGSASLMAHVFLEYYALVESQDNISSVITTLGSLTQELEQAWTGVKFYQYIESITNEGSNRRLLMQLHAFPTGKNLDKVFRSLIENNIPRGQGLMQESVEGLLNAKHKSIHLAANWDNTLGDDYDQEPFIDGSTEHDDRRWEFIAGICTYLPSKVNIKSGANNKIMFKNIVPFTGDLPSHPMANESDLHVTFHHGCQITGARPNFVNGRRVRAGYNLDMLSDSGEGNAYVLPSSSHLNVSAGDVETPVLTLHVSANDTIVTSGDHVEILYNITNTGSVPAYDVEIEDTFSPSPGGFSIISGDSEPDGDVDANWTTILPGESKLHAAVIDCSPSGATALGTDAYLTYHAGTYVETNEWTRNPNDYHGGYQIHGNEIRIIVDESTPFVEMRTTLSTPGGKVGDEITVHMEFNNTGDMNATDVEWVAPVLGLNTSSMDGTIPLIEPGQQATVETTFRLDAPVRYAGLFMEPRFYSQYSEGTVRFNYRSSMTTFTAAELPVNIYAAKDATFGPLLLVWTDVSRVKSLEANVLQVQVNIRNYGDSSAHLVDFTSPLPVDDFSLVSGSNSYPGSYAILPERMTFTYTFMVEVPEGTTGSAITGLLSANYRISSNYNWYNTYCRCSVMTHDLALPGAREKRMILILSIVVGIMGIATSLLVLGFLEAKGKISVYSKIKNKLKRKSKRGY